MTTSARDNALVVNLDLGLTTALEAYLEAERRSASLDFIALQSPQGKIMAKTGFFDADALPVGEGALGYGAALYGYTWFLHAQSPVRTRLWEGSGRVICAIRIDGFVAAIAKELNATISLETETNESELLAEAPDGTPGRAVFASYHFPPSGKERSIRLGAYASMDTQDRARQTGAALLLAAALFAISLSFAARALLAHGIARPALLLTEAARRISGGAYGTVTGIASEDEVGYLAREFDAMSRALADNADRREIAEEALRLSEAKFRAIFDGVAEAVFVHDAETGNILDVNRKALDLFDLRGAELSALSVGDISELESGYNGAAARALINQAVHSGLAHAEWRAHRLSGGPAFWVEVEFCNASVGGRQVVIVSSCDIGERKELEFKLRTSLKEREALIQEVHHRVKNNFQNIASLLDMQSSSLTCKEAVDALIEPRARVHTMALVHERLYQSADLSSIDLGSCIDDLGRDAYSAFANSLEAKVSLSVEFVPLRIKADIAISCGLIPNELVTNAFKYSFTGPDSHLSGSLAHEGDRLIMVVADDGPGIHPEVLLRQGEGLGFTLVRALSDQIGGVISFSSPPGFRAELQFPYTECAN